MSATSTYQIYKKAVGLPVGSAIGRRLFSAFYALKATYFVTILPSIEALEPGRCVATAPKWFGVKNHIGTFHAIALCNLAEYAMGALMEASTPTSHRWIPKGMEVAYTAKAETSLTATATLRDGVDIATITEGRDVVVDIDITDTSGKTVGTVAITTWVSPAKKK